MPGAFRWMAMATLFAGGAATAEAGNWPQWRGPNGNSVSAERDLPVRWSSTENVVWKSALPGNGASTPAIWGDAIFVTAQVDDSLRLLRLDRKNGAMVWDRQAGSGKVLREGPKGANKFHQLHNMASPSPVVDGQRVYAHFGNGDLACFDFDGNVVWKRNLEKDYGAYTIWWGHANSPVLWNDLLLSVCMQDPIRDGKSYLLALDKRTGQKQWLTPRNTGALDESADSYTTPILLEVNGREELIVMGGNALDAHDPATGKLLWRCGGLEGGRTITGPAVGDGVIFVTHGMRGPLVAVKAGGQGDVSADAIQWTHTGSTPDTACPVALSGLVFFVTDNGIASCLDAKTGQQYWKERLGGDFKASPLAADGRIYFVSKAGTTTVVEASKKFNIISKNDLGEEILASPAASDGSLYLRTSEHLFRIAGGK